MKKTVQFKMLINGVHANTIGCSSAKSKRVKPFLVKTAERLGKVTFTRNKPAY